MRSTLRHQGPVKSPYSMMLRLGDVTETSPFKQHLWSMRLKSGSRHSGGTTPARSNTPKSEVQRRAARGQEGSGRAGQSLDRTDTRLIFPSNNRLGGSREAIHKFILTRNKNFISSKTENPRLELATSNTFFSHDLQPCSSLYAAVATKQKSKKLVSPPMLLETRPVQPADVIAGSDSKRANSKTAVFYRTQASKHLPKTEQENQVEAKKAHSQKSTFRFYNRNFEDRRRRAL